ncbi:MAG: 50S ribosomal protein L32 [Patescibacteria group bacterium]
MSLPSHRHTSSKKRRGAAHNALKKANISKEKTSGKIHLSHRAAPGATEYNGKPIHVKPSKRKAEKAAKKLAKSKKAA